MGFLGKLFSKKEDVVEEKETIILSLDELKTKINISLRRVNDIDEDAYSKPVFNKLLKIKSMIDGLMSRKLSDDYNKALMVGANNARNRVYNQLVPLLEISEPVDLIAVNSFIDSANKLLVRAHKVFSKANQAKVLFRDDMNSLSSAFEDLSRGVEHLKEAVSERNEQLESFELIDRDIDNLEQAMEELESLKKDEAKLNKKINSVKSDKAFLLKEIALMKKVEVFEEYDENMKELNKVKKKKASLEVLVRNLFSKFSRAFKKAFKQEPFVEELLDNPLKYIYENKTEYDKKLALLKAMIEKDSIKVGEKTKEKYLRAMNDAKIDDYIASYRNLSEKEKEYLITDNDLINKVRAFERRVLKLNQEKSKLKKKYKSLKQEIFSQKGTVDALKAKVEAGSSKAYSQKVRLNPL